MAVIGESAIKTLMNCLHFDFFPIYDHINFVRSDNFFSENNISYSASNIIKNMGFKSIQTCFVNHCSGATGVAMTHNDGWKICYSGDTAPCRRLIDIGKCFIDD